MLRESDGGAMSESGGSVWKWVGIGCGGCALVAIVGIVVVVLFVRSTMKSVTEGFNDPELRAERSVKTLGIEKIPEGYDPSFHMNIPFTMEVAILGDREFDRDRGFEDDPDRFMVNAWLGWLSVKDRDFRPLLEDPPDWAKFVRRFGVRLTPDDRVGGGRLETADGATVEWEAWDGDYRSGAFNVELEGLSLFWRTTCPSNKKALGLWYRRDPAAMTGVAAGDGDASGDGAGIGDSAVGEAVGAPGTLAPLDANAPASWLAFLEASRPCEGR